MTRAAPSSSLHPSFYALDGLRLTGMAGTDPADPATSAARDHVRTCAACAGYIAAPAPPVPDWLGSASLAPARQAIRARPAWPRLVWLTASAMAVAAALLLLPRFSHRPDDTGGAIREKGTPALQVFVKRDAKVFAWNLDDKLQPNDRLRFEVRGAGARYISVANRPADGGRPTILYSGEIGPGAQLLPLSFQVDADRSPDVVSVITAQRPIAPELHELADEALGRAELWRQILIFKKGPPP
jgi:hypothetical protein